MLNLRFWLKHPFLLSSFSSNVSFAADKQPVVVAWETGSLGVVLHRANSGFSKYVHTSGLCFSYCCYCSVVFFFFSILNFTWSCSQHAVIFLSISWKAGLTLSHPFHFHFPNSFPFPNCTHFPFSPGSFTEFLSTYPIAFCNIDNHEY